MIFEEKIRNFADLLVGIFKKNLSTSILYFSLFMAGMIGSFEANAIESAPHHSFPDRSEQALSGSEFMASISSLSGSKREEAIIEQVKIGNVPDLLRQVVRVPVSLERMNGETTVAGLFVLPDYLAIGSNQDYVHVPMTPGAAQYLASKFGFILPTRKIVNEIYRSAQIKHLPKPLPPNRQMTSSKTYLKHSKSIARVWKQQDKPFLQAGHKKDVVQTNQSLVQSNRVAIYGWHRKNGKPIQNLSLVHGAHYADYSHGIRFVLDRMQVDGKWVSTKSILKSKKHWKLVSDEGPLRSHIEMIADI